MFDLGPAAQEMSRIVSGVRDDQLDDPTPCADWTVRDLIAHVHQFTSVFTDNARKRPVRPPDTLVQDWRLAIPVQLSDLTRAWGEESAWEGGVSVGGVEMTTADNAVVAMEELIVHGWDLARATDQEVRIADASLDVFDRFFELFGPSPAGEGPFGPHAEAPADATRLEATIARTGRDPLWVAPW